MAGEPIDPAPEHLRAAQSREPLGQDEIVALARCHQLCLPHTASSRAGQTVLQALYRALLRDDDAQVVWHRGPPQGEVDLGGFAAGTVALRETEANIRRGLRTTELARLAVHVATMPMHVLSRRRWESLIPTHGIGYILTLGVAAAVTGDRRTIRGSDVLAELEAWFVMRGQREGWVDTELSNERAIAFYERMGYVEVSRAFGQILLKKRLTTAK